MGRSASFVKGLKKGPWTSEEDHKLVAYIEQHGHGSWRALPLKAGLQRCGKSCRLRWTNYLRPDIKRGKFSLQEEQTIIQLHALLGNRWSAIATHLPRRTDNEIKNYWNTHLKKRLTKMGIDPITHKSRTAVNTKLSHMTQWENARLEAEARLVHGPRRLSNFDQRTRIHSGPAPVANKLQPPCLDVLKAWQGISSYKLSNIVSGVETSVSIPTVNLNESVKPLSFRDMITEDHVNNWEISKGLFNTTETTLKDEGTENMFEVSEMIHEDGYMMESLTDSLVNGGNYDGDFEVDNSYWHDILDKLGNNSSFSSFF